LGILGRLTERSVLLALSVAVVTLSVSFEASAEEVVDPRYAYNLEVGGTFGSTAIFDDVGYTQLLLGAFVNFAAPIAENRKVAVSLRGAHGLSATSSGWFETLAVGYRIVSDFERFQTRLDLQLAGDVSRITPRGQGALGTRLAVGPRLAVGGLYNLGRGWRAGLELSAAVLAPRPRAQFEVNPIVSWSW
jgi:hypothetical protein